MRAVWITWERQLRNRSVSSGIEVELHEVLIKGGRLKRYIICSFKTISILREKMPEIVFVQNPSIFLCLLVIHLRWIFGFKVVIDAHFGGVEAFNGNILFQKIIDYCNKSASVVIVSNVPHAERIERLGGRAIVCPDPLPNLDRYRPVNVFGDKGKSVFFICSFDIDEPYQEVLRAFEVLNGEGFKCLISGNFRKVDINPLTYPHTIFTGFTPEDQFYRILFESSVVVDLTIWENCLVCGAYEAMSAEIPLVLSDRKSLRKYFDRGVIYTDHNPDSIASSIRRAYTERERLVEEIRSWKALKTKDNMKTLDEMKNIFDGLCGD